MIDAVAIGELLIDFGMTGTGGDGYPVMEAHPGGAPANFLAAMTKAGCRTAFMGKVGKDAFGDRLIGTLRDAGIGTGGIVQDTETFTTLAFVTFNEKGDRSFSFARKPGADTQLKYEECDLGLIDGARLVHFGTLSLTDEPARSTTRALIAYAKKHSKLISFDPNLRKPLWKDPEDAKREMLWGLGEADIVKISDEEVRFLWDIGPEAGAETILREFGCKLVFVTCGPDGAVYANRNGTGRVPSLTGLRVIDTTGAGDIFGGTAVARLCTAGKAPDDLSSEELALITRSACAAASLSCTKKGGIPSIPSKEEIARALSDGIPAGSADNSPELSEAELNQALVFSSPFSFTGRTITSIREIDGMIELQFDGPGMFRVGNGYVPCSASLMIEESGYLYFYRLSDPVLGLTMHRAKIQFEQDIIKMYEAGKKLRIREESFGRLSLTWVCDVLPEAQDDSKEREYLVRMSIGDLCFRKC